MSFLSTFWGFLGGFLGRAFGGCSFFLSLPELVQGFYGALKGLGPKGEAHSRNSRAAFPRRKLRRLCRCCQAPVVN